ncbi:MAG TPA: trehalose-phosphatase [Sphingomicrobium sp.]|nr:trehalose-phosphatase [Sphingomicrobium sp.]
MELSFAPATAPPPVDMARTSLFLDFDGTLVDLVDRPDDVTVSPDLAALLETLTSRFERRLAVVSGRSIAQLGNFLGALAERLALVGSHGAEIKIPGARVSAPAVPPALRDAKQFFARAFEGREGVLIEVKTLGVAVHYRLDPSAQADAERLTQEFASAHGLEVQKGKMMVEVRTAGHDKGTGIAALMSTPPLRGSVPVFLGDDLTDEAGFRQCAAMDGFGVLVGEPRPTAAQYYIPTVAAVHEWLASL